MLATVGAGLGAGAGHELAHRRALHASRSRCSSRSSTRSSIREGLTVFLRLGEVPPFGQIDLTLEALVYGLLLGARVVAVALCCALFVAAVDPDETLRLFRRVSFRSALTAALAARLMPVLARDARRMADATRVPRGSGRAGPGRVAVLRAVATSALDRAVDVAATLEVRGYGARAAARRGSAPWSRHDLAFAAAPAVAARRGRGRRGWPASRRSPRTRRCARRSGRPRSALAVAVIVVVALAPFADRRGIER